MFKTLKMETTYKSVKVLFNERKNQEYGLNCTWFPVLKATTLTFQSKSWSWVGDTCPNEGNTSCAFIVKGNVQRGKCFHLSNKHTEVAKTQRNFLKI